MDFITFNKLEFYYVIIFYLIDSLKSKKRKKLIFKFYW